jgi:UDP-N-acetylmuramyl pentapeptide phosphotransferase/UDP-N-acetylglucosamine-1-phosphate transferase
VQHAAWGPLTAFAATLVSVWWLARSPVGRIALDHPKPRSLHQSPVPRTGGIGVHLGIVLAWGGVAPSLPLEAWFAFALLLLVSFVDDVRGLPAPWRLAAHLLAAGIVATALLLNDYGAAAVLIGALVVAWMTNLYNFMDGADGVAGGMTVFGFSFYGIAAWLSDSPIFALANASVAAAAAAFLVFNFHPARIFLGDVGSVPLGFVAATFGLVGWLQHDWPWWFPVFVFSPFIVDASVTLARRLVRGERVWEAHRDHYYQRLVQMGWGHRRTAVAEYALMLVSGLLALATLSAAAAGQTVALVATAAVYAAVIAWVERAWRRTATGAAR